LYTCVVLTVVVQRCNMFRPGWIFTVLTHYLSNVTPDWSFRNSRDLCKFRRDVVWLCQFSV